MGFQMCISVVHKWMVQSYTSDCGQVMKLIDILRELVLSMDTYPRTVEVFWDNTQKQLLASCWYSKRDFSLNWQHKSSMRCSRKCNSCLCQGSKTFAGLSMMTGSQTAMDNILCTHLFCRWLEINLLSNMLISIKSSGQTIFSMQEIEFTFQ